MIVTEVNTSLELNDSDRSKHGIGLEIEWVEHQSIRYNYMVKNHVKAFLSCEKNYFLVTHFILQISFYTPIFHQFTHTISKNEPFILFCAPGILSSSHG